LFVIVIIGNRYNYCREISEYPGNSLVIMPLNSPSFQVGMSTT